MDGPAGKPTAPWQHEPTKISQPSSQFAIAPMNRSLNTPQRQKGHNPFAQIGQGERSRFNGTHTVAPLLRRSIEERDERPAKRQKHLLETRRNPSIDNSAAAATTSRDSAVTSSLSATRDQDLEEQLRGQRKSPSSSIGLTYEGYNSRAPLPMHSPSIPPEVVVGTVARMRDDFESRHNSDAGTPSVGMIVGDRSGTQRLQQKRLSNMRDKNGYSKRASDISGNDTLDRSSLGTRIERGQERHSHELHLDVQESFFAQHHGRIDRVHIVQSHDNSYYLDLLFDDEDICRITDNDIQWTTYDDQELLFVCLDRSSPALHRLRNAGKMPSVSFITLQFPGTTLSFHFKNRPLRDSTAYRYVQRLGRNRRAPSVFASAERNWDFLQTLRDRNTDKKEHVDLPTLPPSSIRREPSTTSPKTRSPSVSPRPNRQTKHAVRKQSDSGEEDLVKPIKSSMTRKQAEQAVEELHENARKSRAGTRQTTPPPSRQTKHAVRKQGDSGEEDLIKPIKSSMTRKQAEQAVEELENAKNTRAGTRQTRSKGFKSTPQVDNNEVILVYPSVKGLQITRGEHERLQPGEFLNDTLIEFGLRLWMERLKIHDPQRADQIHVFSPFFYKKLKATDPAAGYAAVRTWTSKVDIFGKQYLVVPINEKSHWYLVVIMYPGNALKSGTRDADKQSPVQPPEQLPDVQQQNDHMEIDSDENIPGIYEQPDLTPSKMSPSRSVTPQRTPRVDYTKSNQSDFMDVSKSPTTSAHGVEEQLLEPDDMVIEEELDELDSSQAEEEGDGEADDAWKTLQDSTYVLTFDSLGSKHPAAQRTMRNYLIQEAKHKKDIDVDPSHILGKLVKSPVQPNFCDCGLYLIKTAEKFLEKPDDFFKRIFWNRDLLTEKHPLWDVPSFSTKREALYEEITQLSEKWKQEKGLKQSGPSQVSDIVEVVGESKAVRPSLSNGDSSDDEVKIVGESLAPKAKKKGRRSGGFGS